MKRPKLLMIIVAVIAMPVLTAFSFNCDTDNFIDACSGALKDFTYVKSFESKEDKQFSYIFSTGHTYILSACDKVYGGGRMVVNVYDRNKKMVASTYVKSTNKHYPVITYKCTATGVYYIETVFDNAGCGLSILGYKKS
jgi:hypothetical protein